MNGMILDDTSQLTKGIRGILRSQTKVITLGSSRTLFCKKFEIYETAGLSLNKLTVA